MQIITLITGLRRLWPYLLLLFSMGSVVVAGIQPALEPLGQTTAGVGAQKIWGSTTVGQSFHAPFDGLHQVSVLLKTGGRGANSSGLRFRLRTDPAATTDLAVVVIDNSTITQDGWVTFEFPPLRNAGGRDFYFLLEAPQAQPETALSALIARRDRYANGSYYLNGMPLKGDLAFSFRARPGLNEWLQGIFELLAHNKPSFWGQPVLYGLLAVIYLALLLLAVRLIALPEEEAPRD